MIGVQESKQGIRKTMKNKLQDLIRTAGPNQLMMYFQNYNFIQQQ